MTRCKLLDQWFDAKSKELDKEEEKQNKDLITGEKEMNWQFVLKAKPSANTILVEIITAFDELYNKIKVADKKSKATGSSIFKNLFKENPDLDTNFETVKKVYEEKMLSQMLSPELVSENELLKRFSMIKELVVKKAERETPDRSIEHNEAFFQKLFSSKKNPANIKELLVIYQKKIADSVPERTRRRYTESNQENTARIQSLYKKNQEKPTVEQFRKNEVPNFDYVLVKVIVEGKEKPKKRVGQPMETLYLRSLRKIRTKLSQK